MHSFIIFLFQWFTLCSISFSCTKKKFFFFIWRLNSHNMLGRLYTNHNQDEEVRTLPSLLLCQNSTIEYWNMLTFKPPYICFSNNSTWTCSKLPFKFPKPVYHNKEKEICIHSLLTLELNKYNKETVQRVMPKQDPKLNV